MRPVAPRIDGLDEEAIDGEKFKQITVARDVTEDNHPAIVTRWRLTDEERQAIASGEDLFLVLVGYRMQPVQLHVGWPYRAYQR